MADLDGESQARMSDWYDRLKEAGFTGEQTKDIPYHISLATFSLDRESEAVAEMKRLADEFAPIPVNISHIGLFAGGKVLFAAPDMSVPELLSLHDAIRTETIDSFPWTPHVTMLLDEPDTVQRALGVFIKSFRPFAGRITRLHLCEFWPTREIASFELKHR